MAYENHIFVKQQFGMANIEHDDIMVGANSSEKARQRTFAMPNLCNTNHSDCIFNSRDKCDICFLYGLTADLGNFKVEVQTSF